MRIPSLLVQVRTWYAVMMENLKGLIPLGHQLLIPHPAQVERISVKKTIVFLTAATTADIDHP